MQGERELQLQDHLKHRLFSKAVTASDALLESGVSPHAVALD